MSKRSRNADQELFEGFAALLRQSATRAMERMKLRRPPLERASGGAAGVQPGGGNFPPSSSSSIPGLPAAPLHHDPLQQQQQQQSSSLSLSSSSGAAASLLQPIDRLVVQYAMYYLDLSAAPPHHYVRLSQEVITASPDRVLQPGGFAKLSLPQLCEDLVAECTAAEVEATLRDIEEFVDVRAVLGEWLADRAGGGDGDDDGYDEYADGVVDGYDEDASIDRDYERWKRERGLATGEEEGNSSNDGDDDDATTGSSRRKRRRGGGVRAAVVAPGAEMTLVDLAGLLYESLGYWLRMRDFLLALSRGSADAYAYPLRPRYERELMLLLHSLSNTAAAPAGILGPLPTKTAASAAAKGADGVDQPTAAKAKTEQQGRDGGGLDGTVVKVEPVGDDDNGDDAAAGAPLDTAAMTRAAAAAATIRNGDDDDVDATEGQQRGGGQPARNGDDDDDDDDENDDSEEAAERRRKREVTAAVLADALALSRCRPADSSNSSSSSGSGGAVVAESLRARAAGIDARFYAMVHARLGVMVSRDRLRQFSTSRAAAPPPELTVAQRNTLEREAARRRDAAVLRASLAQASAVAEAGAASIGVPLDYVPDDQYYTQVLAQQREVVGEDEEIFKDEVVDYYIKKQEQRQQQQQLQQQQTQQQQKGRGGRNAGASSSSPSSSGQQQPQPQVLVKPHRYCKVKTGYTWTQYNRTHYDSRTNPPPRTVLWYEFTLFYPALVNTRRDMRNIFRIEDTPRGPADDYCLLVFSPGPPYEDVAYRIVKKQWDTRRGGVRISFDATGRYKLFFRFTNSNYRR